MKVAVGIRVSPAPRNDPHERALAHADPTSGANAKTIQWIRVYDSSDRNPVLCKLVHFLPSNPISLAAPF